jgi:hypothetical protein
LNPLTGCPDDAVSKEFDKLLKRLGMKRPGLAFYALRRTFRTVADETLDQPATRLVMGHIDAGIDNVHRGRVFRPQPSRRQNNYERVNSMNDEWVEPDVRDAITSTMQQLLPAIATKYGISRETAGDAIAWAAISFGVQHFVPAAGDTWAKSEDLESAIHGLIREATNADE